ncbi:thiopurine S-methyltransferase [Legionella norrlandica]|uniref:Thiopurine S-methyltransferase n=1 Tax=Legionella norrlandica TaxID=1498499 RepID=A0A0A2TA62_9GAMM|nr:thiopurine S-methyltransferase [Legionella norrlandica]KGP64308.1 thiopurine S-methyltransferase [Legionella norrlandica]
MNKGQHFWAELWRDGRTFFHKEEVNEDLVTYFPYLNVPEKGTILVPLCGKSLDMLWLNHQGYHVVGIELIESAVLQFAQEHQILFQQETIGEVKHFFTDKLSLWVADIFTLNPMLVRPVDAIYDRAALVALPKKLRSLYAEICLKWLKSEGNILLKTLEYQQEEMQGPPYSVSAEEVATLYQQCAAIQLLKSQVRVYDNNDPLFMNGLNQVTDHVWIIKKE